VVIDPRRAAADLPAPRPWTTADTRRLLAVALAALVLFGYGLGAGSLWDQDEPRYFQISRELLDAPDPFTLRLDGRPWFVHPPLWFWLQSATARALGFTEFAARVWSAISGAGMVAAAFLLGRLLVDDGPAASLAGAVTATTLHVLAQARLAVFDPTLVAFMLLAFYMALVGYTSGARGAYVWAGLWAGLATATKGPIGLALPAMVMAVLWAARRDWWAWRQIPILAVAVFALVGLPWYVVEGIRHGLPFFRTAIGYYLFNRFFGVVENQPGPWWYYAPVLLLGTLPWTAFAPPALMWLWRRRGGLAAQAILIWCAVVVVFYSAAGTKLPNYVLPVYPVLAVGIGGLLGGAALQHSGQRERLLWLAAVLLPIPSVVFGVAVFVYGRVQYPAEAAALALPVAAVAVLLAGGPLVACGLLLARRTRAAVITLLLVPVLMVPVLVHYTLPAIEVYRPVPRLGRLVAAELRPQDGLAVVRLPLASSMRFYSAHPVLWVEGPRDLAQTLCDRERVYLVVPAAEDAWVRPLLPPVAQLRAEDAGLRLYLKDGPASCARAPAPAR
jgi:4-amino-4-deoxy-L-arabinose transferase-like glycosyltransferase